MTWPGVRERVLSGLMIDPDTGCLVWTRATASVGYGITSHNGRQTYVHRLMYEWFVGPILDGLVIDHLCRNPVCAAPAHLEAVTQQENVLRGKGPAAANAAKTHCLRGHAFDLFNTHWERGRRVCRACRRARDRKAYFAEYRRTRRTRRST